MPSRPLVIGIVAGEVSGDLLGADFMTKMNDIHPNVKWVGVGGVNMTALGLTSIINMNRLSVMGIGEVVRHLPDLLRAKQTIVRTLLEADIDIFIGIDAPDFNLRLSHTFKNQTHKRIFCVQYVSPSVWAWRENRIKHIKSVTDLVLCLFPFELAVYQKHRHPAVCVGHPLLTKLSADPRPPRVIFDEFITRFREYFPTLDTSRHHKRPICVMAGSRSGEIGAILPLLVQTMERLYQTGEFTFILPTVSQQHADTIYAYIRENAPDILIDCHVIYPTDELPPHDLSVSQQCMNACELILLASGTATLEALLLHRPMVVVYKVKPITYTIAKRLIKIPYVSLPNILSHNQTGQAIIPELIQEDATPDRVSREALALLDNPKTDLLTQTTERLRKDSHHHVAETVLEYFYNQKNVL